MAALTRPAPRGALLASFALAVDRPARWLALLNGGDAWPLARRSFLALGFALPLLLASAALAKLSWTTLSVQLLGNLVAWLGFAAFSELVLARSPRPAAWPRMIAVWNWCNVVQIALLLPTLIPPLLPVPNWVRSWVALVFWGWALWLDYRAIRLGLDRAGDGVVWPAIGLTFADLAIGVLCQSLGA